MFLDGQQFGRYRFERLIDRGGMGEIYLATDMHLQRNVAIKVVKSVISLRANAESIAEAIRLFQREAKAVTMLEHPHILPLYDYGEESLDGTLLTYFVMPYRQEGSLEGWVSKRGKSAKISLYDAAHFLPQAASALQYAHDHDIIHRDVKPSNFLLVYNKQRPGRPDLQLTDFGVAKFMKAVSTPTGVIRGTPVYMAPEQWKGEAVPASDQYALAVMMYQFLTGRPPFQGTNHLQLRQEHAYAQATKPSALNMRIPGEVDAVLMKALAKEPEQRYKSIDAFARAFQQSLLQKNNIAMTLVINQLEARDGTKRRVTVAGGRQVTIHVPAGAYDGLVIRLDGMGSPSKFGGPAGDLIVTLSLEKTEKIATVAALEMVRPSVQTRELKPLPPMPPQRKPPRRNKRRIFFIGLVSFLLIVISGLGAVFYSVIQQSSGKSSEIISTNHRQTENTNAALQASQTTDAPLKATASAAGYATNTALAAATASAMAATETAQFSATQTAVSVAKTAVAGATATSMAATATATGFNNILNVGPDKKSDALQSSAAGFSWDSVAITSGAGCGYMHDAYHSQVTQGNSFSACFEHQYGLSDFSCLVSMTILQGNIEGIAFRADPTTGSFYYFSIDAQGDFALMLVSDFTPGSILAHGTNPAVHAGLNQTNQVAVVAKGSSITVYVNMVQVAQVSDSTYTTGNLGLVAQDVNASTDVAFQGMQISY